MQKNLRSQSAGFIRLLFSYFLVMTLIVGCAGKAASAVMQGRIDAKVSVSFKNETLHSAIRKLAKATDIQFAYNSKDLKGLKVLDHTYNQAAIRDVLRDMLASTALEVEEVNNMLVIRKKTDQSKVGHHNEKLLATLTPQPAVHKDIAISGLVTDHRGAALPGVNVVIKGTTSGVSTDQNGKFLISVGSLDQTLVFSFIGYKTQEVPISGHKLLNVSLKEDIAKLEEVVVVGYGTIKKSDLTGAVGVVKADEALSSRPATNVQELLAGNVPGLNVLKGSGAVGSGASINIRGTSTIGNSSGVLVLIDGMPGNIYTLNPNDIESISVLKDAASAAIYGSRAANGVLLVTTKQGKTGGKPVIELNTSLGVQNSQFQLDFVGAEQFMQLWDRALVNDGKQPIYGEQGLQDLKNGKYADNKWYREIYKRNTLISNNSLAISGGADAVTYRLSGSYDYQDGTLPNNSYNRFIVRPDMSLKLTNKLSLGARIQYTETYINQPQGGTTGWQSEAARASPISPIYNKLGQYGVGSSMVGNPIAAVNKGGYYKEKYKEMFSVFDLTYKIAENWNAKGSFSRYSSDMWSTNRVSRYDLYSDAGAVAAQKNLVTSLKEASTSSFRNMFQFTTDYALNIRKHGFKLLAGYSQEYFQTKDFSAFRDNMPFNSVDVLNVGASTNMQNTGKATDVAIQSVFGRVNYDFDGKYLFQANFRGDGSSRFAKNYRWGFFPSFSAGWNLHQESFFQLNWISQFKFRGSWGILGDAEKVTNYATAEVLAYDPEIYGFNGAVAPGAYNSLAINRAISWEQAKQTNAGVDVSFLGNRINLTVDYFFNKRDRILYQAPPPTEFGLAAPFSNLLRMNNQGWEFAAGYRDSKGAFHWGLDANLGFSKNEITDMAGTGPWKGTSTFSDVGTQYNLPYGLRAIGLFQSQEEILNSPNQGANVFPGNIKFQDQNGDNKIDGNDMVILYKKVPLRFGASLNLGWKSFDFSMNAYGALNAFRYMSSYEGWAFYLSQNARPLALDNWTPENPDASYPRLSIQYTANDTKYSSYWMRKSDYVKIQNAQVGYTLPASALEALHLKYLRIYVSGQNLATISSYPGFDPEGSWYPISRTYSFGINLKF